MPDVIAKMVVGLMSKLLTEQFLSRVIYFLVKTWANQTDNQIDDKIADAIADAFGVEKQVLVKNA
jgi:hypothetical protein